MKPIKNVALVAHDNRKQELVEWLQVHQEKIINCHIVTTGTTGLLIENSTDLKVERVNSGPLGGDQQIGARISEGEIDLLVFFWDPLEPMPHDPDVKALLRLSTLWNIPIACNKSTADFIIKSPLMFDYQRTAPDFGAYQARKV